MKKFFAIMAIAISMVAFSSCREKINLLIWNVEITGDADGAVDITFPNGELSLGNGTDFNFHYGNDTTVTNEVLFGAEEGEVVTFGEALVSEDEEVKEAAELFSATALEGTYAVHFNGYVYVPLTSVRIQIDTTFTNRVPVENAE